MQTRGDQQPEHKWSQSFAFFHGIGVDSEFNLCFNPFHDAF